jgi:hypothetical protein
VVQAATASIIERRQQDPLVQFRAGTCHRQRTEEAQDPGTPADLGGARCATLDVTRQARRICRFQLIEQERVDQGVGVRAIQGAADVRVGHIHYMT